MQIKIKFYKINKKELKFLIICSKKINQGMRQLLEGFR